MTPSLTALTRLNYLLLEGNELFLGYAKRCGLSDSTFIILYILRDLGNGVNQQAVCRAAGLPKQTVSSAMKRMEADGLLSLRAVPGCRGKAAFLTEAGDALAARSVDPLRTIEAQALLTLSEAERRTLFQCLQHYNDTLRRCLTASSEART